VSRQIATIVTRHRNSEAAAELAAMTDRELADIGLNRCDLPRVFDPAQNQDLSFPTSLLSAS
jgi:uncharacterized protein YjiS (DUF1127 family)